VFELVPRRVRRTVRAGGPPALITAGLGLGATGLAGPRVERTTDPVARSVVEAVGVGPGLGPVLLVLGAVLVFVVAFVVPGLFEDAGR